MKISSLQDFEKTAEEASRRYWEGGISIRVGMATCGLAAGADSVYEAAERLISKDDNISLSRVGCRGYCIVEPMVEVVSPEHHLIFKQVTPSRMQKIVDAARAGDFSSFEKNGRFWHEKESPRPNGSPFVTRKAYGGDIAELASIPFYKDQKKIVTRNCGHIDPFSIDDALARDAYQALAKVLKSNDPDEVIATVTNSGLRGRGGAGFPTGRKWSFAKAAPGDEKYVFVNADEGDPGAFMDRSVLESDPHAVLEGMAIGGFAIGASTGILYIRAEYPLAVEVVRNAIDQAREYGLLGENILGTGFSFDVEIKIGAGAFVCGEETALIASAEGKVGEPRPRPPYPAQAGYRGKPTLINNVKTWASIAPIVLNGAEWFSSIGSGKSKGTAVFCITGAIKNTGLVEIPLGTTIEDIVFNIGGGPEKKGREIKAVQTGGPSGGCLPRAIFDIPVDYEHLTQAGSMMGSGGMIVVDNTTCMVDLARFFLSFTMEESCGKCTPCREGTRRMYHILEKITKGEADEADLQLLSELADYIKDTSLCGLGTTAPNPVISTMKYFRDEYETHVRDRKCPAGSCTALISFSVIPENCTVCGACIKSCPVNAIRDNGKQPPDIDQALCTKCRSCFEVCPSGAIRIE